MGTCGSTNNSNKRNAKMNIESKEEKKKIEEEEIHDIDEGNEIGGMVVEKEKTVHKWKLMMNEDNDNDNKSEDEVDVEDEINNVDNTNNNVHDNQNEKNCNDNNNNNNNSNNLITNTNNNNNNNDNNDDKDCIINDNDNDNENANSSFIIKETSYNEQQPNNPINESNTNININNDIHLNFSTTSIKTTFTQFKPSSTPLPSPSSSFPFLSFPPLTNPSLYHLSEFHLNTSPNFSTASDYFSIISSYSSSQNKLLLSTNLLKLKPRQWLQESIHLSNFIKTNRINNYDLSLSKYLHQLLLLHNDFTWLIHSLSYIYNQSLLNNQPNSFGDISEYAFPPVDSLDWLNGFEWKGVFIKVLPRYKAKAVIHEVKGLRYVLYDYIQVIDCMKVNVKDNTQFLSNELVFPLIAYCDIGSVVLYGSACVNGYKYSSDDNTGDMVSLLGKSLNNANFEETMRRKNKVMASTMNECVSIGSISFDEEVIANYDVDIDMYNVSDLKCSKILGGVTKCNFIKVFDTGNNEDDGNTNVNNNNLEFKLMLINAYDLIPNIIEKTTTTTTNNNNTIHLLHINNSNNICSYETYTNTNTSTFPQQLQNDLTSKYGFSRSDFSPCTIRNHTYTYETTQYNIIYSTTPSTISTSNTSLISTYFLNLPFLQNETLSKLLLQKHSSSPLLPPITIPSTSSCAVLYKHLSPLKQHYSLITPSSPLTQLSLSSFHSLLNTFTTKLNTTNSITDINSLKYYFNKYSINLSFAYFFTSAVLNKTISEYIHIYTLCSVIKKFFAYHEGTNLYHKLHLLFLKENTLRTFPLTSFQLNSKNYYKSMQLIRNEKIYIMIKAILTADEVRVDINTNNNNNTMKYDYNYSYNDNNMQSFFESVLSGNSNNNSNNHRKSDFVSFLFKQLSFFMFMKYLKLKSLCEEYKLSKWCYQCIDTLSVKEMMNRCITSAREHPFTFLNAIEDALNINIDVYMKNQLAISINNIEEFNVDHITQSELKVHSFVNTRDISTYVLAKVIHIHNNFNNLSKSINLDVSKANNQTYMNNISNNNGGGGCNNNVNACVSSFIQSLPQYKGIHFMNNNNNTNNAVVGVNQNNITNVNLNNQTNINTNTNANITNKLQQSCSFVYISNNKIHNCTHATTTTWKDIFAQLCFDIILPSIAFKLPYKASTTTNIYKHLSYKYHICNFNSIIEWQCSLEQITFNVISPNNTCESELFNTLTLTFLYYFLIEQNELKSNEMLMKLHNMHNIQFKCTFTQVILLNIFDALVNNDNDVNYYKAMMLLVFIYADVRAKHNKGHSFMLLPLFKIAKHTEKNPLSSTNEYFKEMYRCLDYKLNHNNISTCESNELYVKEFSFIENNSNDNTQFDCKKITSINDNHICSKFYYGSISSLTSNSNESHIFTNSNKQYITFMFNSILSLLCNNTFIPFHIISKFNLYNNNINMCNNATIQPHSIYNANFYLKELTDILSFNKHSPNGILLSFGHNTHNQTAHDGYDKLTLPRLIYHLTNYKIIRMACGNEHTLALDDNKRCFSWGNNSNGQCGIGSDKLKVKHPERITSLPNDIRIVSAGADFSFFSAHKNDIYFCGKNHSFSANTNSTANTINTTTTNNKANYDKPIKLTTCTNIMLIQDIQCGDKHALILTKEGHVYSWGNGDVGQLGITKARHNESSGGSGGNSATGGISNHSQNNSISHITSNSEMQLRLYDVNEFQAGTKITHIACGQTHSLALTDKSFAFSWGLGMNGELSDGKCICTFTSVNGVSSNNNTQIQKNAMFKCRTNLPQKITGINGVNAIYAGYTSSFFINDKGLYGTGLNTHNQITDQMACAAYYNEKCYHLSFPKQIETFDNMKVVKVSCGAEHCLAIVEDGMSGKVAVFSWGNNDKGQIGVGQHVRMNRPGVVGYLNEYSNSKVLDICCGKYFSMVLMKRNDCEEFYKEPKVNYRVVEVCCEFA